MRLRYCTTCDPPADSIEAARKLLEPGDERERHREALEGAGAEQEQSLLLDARMRLFFLCGARLLPALGQNSGALADAEHIEDEGHAAVAHDRRARILREPFQLLAERLDHDLLRIVDAVDHKPKLAIFGLQNHNAEGLGSLRRLEPQYPVQIGNGQQAPAPPINRCAVDLLDVLLGGISLEADQLEQTDLRNDEALASAADHQAGNNGQRERNLQLDCGALAGPVEYIDHAADLLDIGLDDVHADAASGNLGHGLRRRKAGLEDQVQRLAVAQLLRLFRPQQTFLDSLLLYLNDVNPGPVIANFDVDLPAFVISAKRQSSLRRFARAGSDIRRLDPVVARIADQVHQGVFNRFDDGPVQFRVGSIHLQPDLLPQCHGHVTHHARQLIPNHADGLHARLHDAFLQLRGDQVQPLGGRIQSRILALRVELKYLIARQDQLADQVH